MALLSSSGTAEMEGSMPSRLPCRQGALHIPVHGPDPAVGLEKVSDGIPRTDGCHAALQSKLLQVCWAGL